MGTMVLLVEIHFGRLHEGIKPIFVIVQKIVELSFYFTLSSNRVWVTLKHFKGLYFLPFTTNIGSLLFALLTEAAVAAHENAAVGFDTISLKLGLFGISIGGKPMSSAEILCHSPE